MNSSPPQAYRGGLLSFREDPDKAGSDAYQYWEDGLMLVEGGLIRTLGSASELLGTLPPDTRVIDHRGKLILPGFIDTHIHYPQTGVIGAYGAQLMDWLKQYTFPAEQRFSDRQHAQQVARFFLDELLRNGTTTALVFATVHPESVEALFSVAHARNMRMICGKVMMDRNAPKGLTDSAKCSYDDSHALIERWHGKGRQQYAVTPRFAITSTPEQLRLAGELCREHPTVYMQTHLSENRKEIELVRELFPERSDYLDVYDHYGLVHDRSVFAHGIHLSEREHIRLREAGASVAFCPTSNLFLGSGLLDLKALTHRGVATSIATDVGAGTSFNLFRTLSEAYKICQLQGQSLSALKALYMATLGNARCLHLEDKIGSLDPGKEADFTLISLRATPLLDFRMSQCRTLEERLFALMTLADDRAVQATYIAGQCLYQRSQRETP